MANKRVTDIVLTADFVDGEILYGADVNKIITILKGAVNANKADADKIITGSSTPNVVYSYEALSAIVSPSNGDLGIVYNPEVSGDGLKVYEYLLESNTWSFKYTLSLIELKEEIINKRSHYVQETQPENWVQDDVWYDLSNQH